MKITWILISILFWFVFKFLDPLGVETATKQTSAAFFDAIESPFYGLSSKETHKKVAVVTINDHTLEYFDQSFPFTYKTHVSILQKILSAQPAAIYVDLRMMHERTGETLSSFIPFLRDAEHLHVPIFFARGSNAENQPDLPEPLHEQQAFSVIRNEKGMYPLLVRNGHAEFSNGAFAIYQSLCKTTWASSCGKEIEEEFDEPMQVRWGVKGDSQQSLVSSFSEMDGACTNPDDHSFICNPFVLSARQGLVSFFKVLRKDDAKAGFYPLVIGAEQLGFRGRNTEVNAPPLVNLLTGRAVFYGVDLLDQHDDMLVPSLGVVPNVVVHAMAFDNLMVYGSHYFKESKELFKFHGFSLDYAELCELLLWCFLVGIVNISKYKRAKNLNDLGSFLCKISPTLGRYWSFIVAFSVSLFFFIVDVCQVYDPRKGIFSLLCAYCLFFILLIISLKSLKKYNNYLMNCNSLGLSEDEIEGIKPISHLWILSALAALGFVANKLCMRWPNADWIGLLLMWVALAEWKEWRESLSKSKRNLFF